MIKDFKDKYEQLKQESKTETDINNFSDFSRKLYRKVFERYRHK